MTQDDIRNGQLEALRSQLNTLMNDDSRPFFRRRLEAAGFQLTDLRELADLSRIPPTTKEDLRSDEEQHPPFGTYNSSDLTRYVRVQATSGTTGTPTHVFWTAQDILIERQTAARGLARTGMRPEDIVSHSYPFGTTVSGEIGINVSQAIEELGALCIPVGAPETTADAIDHLRRWIASGTTYLHFWGPLLATYEEAAQQEGINLNDLSVSRLLVAEPALQFAGPRELVVRRWGCEVFNIYGAKEFQAFLGTDCAQHQGLHLAEDRALVEIVDAAGVPVRDGVKGMILLTSLYRDTALLRYNTGDIGWIAEGSCGCGEQTRRLYYEGRTDELCLSRDGQSFFPLGVQRVLAELCLEYGVPYTPEYEILRDHASGEAVLLRAEAISGSVANVSKEIASRLASVEGVHDIEVEIVETGALPRSPFKLVRVKDT